MFLLLFLVFHFLLLLLFTFGTEAVIQGSENQKMCVGCAGLKD